MSDYQARLEIEPRIHLIRGENNGRFPEANCIVVDDEILTLIDAGASRRQIENSLRELGHKISEIDRIILTHFHVDHKGLAAEIQQESDCELLCHPLAVQGVSSFDGLIECYGIARHRHFESWKNLMRLRLPHVMQDYRVTGTFQDRRPISCGEIELIPIHLPGHTKDHTCFGLNDMETLLLVDIDLTQFGPWYGNDVSDIQEFKNSVQKLIDMQPTTGISSHLLEPVTDGLHDELVRYLSIFDEREERVIKNVRRGFDSIAKLASVPTIYPRLPFDLYSAFEEFMLEKHIELLLMREVLREDDGHLVAVKR